MSTVFFKKLLFFILFNLFGLVCFAQKSKIDTIRNIDIGVFKLLVLKNDTSYFKYFKTISKGIESNAINLTDNVFRIEQIKIFEANKLIFVFKSYNSVKYKLYYYNEKSEWEFIWSDKISSCSDGIPHLSTPCYEKIEILDYNRILLYQDGRKTLIECDTTKKIETRTEIKE
jgi:hypothetical protein